MIITLIFKKHISYFVSFALINFAFIIFYFILKFIKYCIYDQKMLLVFHYIDLIIIFFENLKLFINLYQQDKLNYEL